MRQLNKIEQAFTLINDYYPFNAVCALMLRSGPEPHVLRMVLDRLQHSHLLLQAGIKERNGNFWFEKDKDSRPVPLHIVQRKDDNHWQDLVRLELNNGFSTDVSPLMRVIYLVSNSGSENSEIILTFHHAIIDAASFLLMADQLLTMAGENMKHKEVPAPFPLAPELTDVLPASFRGIRLIFRLIPFLFRQMNDELIYKMESKKVNDSVIPTSSENDFLTLGFSREETTALVKWSRRQRLSLNSIISAAMLIVVNRYCYNGRKELLRTIQFGNLRPYLFTPVPAASGGSFVAMMRFTMKLKPREDLVKAAASLDHQLLKSSRRGDKFIYALLMRMLAEKTIRAGNARLGSTALSYAGPIQLKQQYGDIQLVDIHGFITNNCLGAQLTGFGKIWSGELSIDLNFLVAETSGEKAIKLAKELKTLLLQSVKGL